MLSLSSKPYSTIWGWLCEFYIHSQASLKDNNWWIDGAAPTTGREYPLPASRTQDMPVFIGSGQQHWALRKLGNGRKYTVSLCSRFWSSKYNNKNFKEKNQWGLESQFEWQELKNGRAGHLQISRVLWSIRNTSSKLPLLKSSRDCPLLQVVSHSWPQRPNYLYC